MHGKLGEFEDHRAGAHAHAHFPVRRVDRLAFELQGLDGIEGDDIVGIGGGDVGDVAVAHGLHPAIDQLADLGFGCGAHRGASDST
ncbi:hypothetical protein D3C81_1491150 [compost metagenome]